MYSRKFFDNTELMELLQVLELIDTNVQILGLVKWEVVDFILSGEVSLGPAEPVPVNLLMLVGVF